MISGLLLFLLIVNAYLLLVFLAARSGLLARYNIGLMGPILMFRTERGKGFIEWLAKAKRFHTHLGTVGVWVTLGCMGALMLLLLVQLPLIFRIPVEHAPQARHILALPGINPLIPIGYGIVALIAAIVIHEFAHGVLARAQDLKVKTLGVLFLVVPIGAFVEPDEEEMKVSSRKKRMRVYAAGPMSNIITALILGVIFSAGFVAAMVPVADGLGVRGVVDESPADLAGIDEGTLITGINNQTITTGPDFSQALRDTRPGDRIEIHTARHGTLVACLASQEDARNLSELGPGIDWCNRYQYEDDANVTAVPPGHTGPGFLGVQMYPFGTVETKQHLQNPFGSLASAALYVALPFTGLTPFASPMTDLYEVPWGEHPIAVNAYWISANLAYWVMWISLMLGLTNALPAVPLDGGWLFRDWLDGVINKLRPKSTPEGRAPVVKRASIAISLLVLVLILLQFLGPRIAPFFL
jgi:membrane-associated protease RseP (regulator of RpoE activity)